MSVSDLYVRRLRVLLVANDGSSVGHVARILAVAEGLTRQASRRRIELASLLATTSEAHQLTSDRVAVVRLPAPVAARRAGMSDAERRCVAGAAIEGVVDAFVPDLIVVDTFPSGPHGELTGILSLGRGPSHAKRAIVRRSVPAACAEDAKLVRGLDRYDLAIVADDPFHDETVRLPIKTVHVRPITMFESQGAANRDAARAHLDFGRFARSPETRFVLLATGGGADDEAKKCTQRIVKHLRDVAPDVVPIEATGPLASGASGASGVLHVAPLAPWFAAFDGAISAAGYNTSHELVKAGVPTVLFGMPRPFDDQAARARRFADASLAFALERFDEDAVRAAMAWIDRAPRVSLPSGGADEAARALLDLVCGEAAS